MPLVTSSSARSSNSFKVTVKIDMGNLPTLPEEMMSRLNAALVFHFKDAADAVIETVRGYLVRLEDEPLKNSLDGIGIHGYDTGAMSAGFKAALAEDVADLGVFYSIFDEEPYWTFVEFGHWTRAGTFWPGYHMVETALQERSGTIRQAAREAWYDTAVALALQARVPGSLGLIGLAGIA